MSNIIYNEMITNEYCSLLAYLPSEFHVIGQCKIPQIIIPEIATDEYLQYPLSELMVSKILSKSKPSAFGKGTETIHDTNIRTCKELDGKQFTIKNETFSFSSKSNKCLESIRQSLMPHIEYIICEPYKLLIYEKNSFFKSHVDTPTENQFASLIVSLPTSKNYQGGDFILNFNQKQIKWNFNNSTINNVNNLCSEYISFYSNIHHEIKPVTSGHRIVITFNLIIPHEFNESFEEAMDNDCLYVEPSDFAISLKNRFCSPFVNRTFDAISNSEYCKEFCLPNSMIWIIIDFNGDHNGIEFIRKLLNGDATFDDKKEEKHENAVCLVLSHQYHGEYINPLHLKGEDMHLYNLFKQYFGIYLTPVTFKIHIGTWSDEYSDYEDEIDDNYSGRMIEEWDADPSNASIRIGENAYWKHQVPDTLMEKLDVNKSKFVVLYNNQKTTYKAGVQEDVFDTCYGNVGAYNIHNLYYCTGLLLMSYKRDTEINREKLSSCNKRKISFDDESPLKKQKTGNIKQ